MGNATTLPARVPRSAHSVQQEEEHLARLASRGAVRLPNSTKATKLAGPQVANRGKLASELLLENRW